MPVYHIWDSWIGPPASDTADNYNWGIAFKVNVEGYITKLRWWDLNSGSPHHPDALSLYQAGNTTAVAQSIPAPDPTPAAPGWKDYLIPTPVLAVPNTIWIVVAHYPDTAPGAGTVVAKLTAGTFPPVPAAFTLDPNWRRSLESGIAYPTDSSAGHVPIVDVELDTEWTPNTPSGAVDIENALSRWFSSGGDNTRQGELPWLTHLLSSDTNTKVDVLDAITDDILATIDAAMGPGGSLVTGTVRAALDGLYDLLKTDVEAQPGVIMGPGNPTIADVMTAIAGVNGGGSCHLPMTVGGLDWTEVGQTTGTGGYEWGQEADAYVFHLVGASEALRSAEGVGSELIYWLRGWAMPWDGTRLYPTRINFVGPDAVIIGGGHWPGILMQVPPDVEWTLTAYNYTP